MTTSTAADAGFTDVEEEGMMIRLESDSQQEQDDVPPSIEPSAPKAAKRSLREREQINYNEVRRVEVKVTLWLGRAVYNDAGDHFARQHTQEALHRKLAILTEFQPPPAKRSKQAGLARALQQVDHNTPTERRTADSVNLPHNMLSDEEEALLPDGADEALYIRVWGGM